MNGTLGIKNYKTRPAGQAKLGLSIGTNHTTLEATPERCNGIPKLANPILGERVYSSKSLVAENTKALGINRNPEPD